MIKAMILDFDQTLVDTSSLSKYRLSGQWDVALKMLLKLNPYEGIHHLFEILHQLKIPIVIVTASPKAFVFKYIHTYNWPVLEVFDTYDDNNQKTSKMEAFKKAITYLKHQPKHIYSLSDLNQDALTANQLGIISLHAAWSHETSLDATQSFSKIDDFIIFIKSLYKDHFIS
jgi:phosphoglycolate phosphatase-like HAD superfamily hydrolase